MEEGNPNWSVAQELVRSPGHEQAQALCWVATARRFSAIGCLGCVAIGLVRHTPAAFSARCVVVFKKVPVAHSPHSFL
eukprot:9501886-Pyramimonas_sp.AAC.2